MPEEPSVRSCGPHAAAFLQPPGDWFLNNAGWIAGPDATLLIDTCATEARTRHLVQALQTATRTTTETPLTVAVTHAHGDHANGAGLLNRSGATVIATDRAAEQITSGPHTFPDVFTCSTWGDIAPPDTITTISNPTALDLGRGLTAEIIPVPGIAHTAGDLVVWCPREGVLFAGDLLFDGVTPLAIQGSPTGWLAALDWLADFDATHIVPGHGPTTIATGDVIGQVTDYLHWLLDSVSDNDDPDLTALERQARQRWPHWADPERHIANLTVAHADLHGQPINQQAALTAMLTATDGPIALNI